MTDFGSPSGAPHKQFRIKLNSGRVLGPVNLHRIALLILKNQIIGTEQAKELPEGEWKAITQFPDIADLILKKLEGKLSPERLSELEPPPSPDAKTQLLPGSDPTDLPFYRTNPSSAKSKPENKPPIDPEKTKILPPTLELDMESNPHEDVDETVVESQVGRKNEPRYDDFSDFADRSVEEESKTEVQKAFVFRDNPEEGPGRIFELDRAVYPPKIDVAQERTVLFEMPGIKGARIQNKKKKLSIREKIWVLVLTSLLVYLTQDWLFEAPSQNPIKKVLIIRPQLPATNPGEPDVKRSQQFFVEGVKFYLLDTVDGYRRAAEKFLVAASIDPSNVRATALLASSYLNLIDSSNKDENYFSVIHKLIELSRSKNIDLPETVIADSEFYAMANKAEAAENRIIEYTKLQRNFGIDMYYYLAWVLYLRGDYRTSARYLTQFPDNKASTPRIFHLRGQLAEKLSSQEEALQEYSRAIALSPTHVKSRLRIAWINYQAGRITDASPHIQYAIAHPQLSSAKELAQGYFLFGKLKERLQNYPEAVEAMEKATALDRGNSDYLYEFYSLKAKTGADISKIRGKARMYFFMSEGEKLLQQGQNQEAMNRFLQARESDYSSPVPLLRIGDMFVRQHDAASALLNYKKAAELAPTNVQIGSKYIQALIQNFEWKEAQKAMDRFRGNAQASSTIDKLAGDMYAKQGMYAEAMSFYKKAMARETIDPEVYMSYAKALMATRNYQYAPLFFSLATRLDPLNIEALIGSAQAVAQNDSIDRGISILQDEIQRTGTAKAELFSAIAALQIQKGDWLSAQQSVNQAIESNPDYPDSYRYRAQIQMNRLQSGGLKGREYQLALDQALNSYKSYSDRNVSDPSGYLERFRIYAELKQYDKADAELARVYSLFPKYPSLHLLQGNLYLVRGDRDQAMIEYQSELTNNPNNVDALMAMAKEFLSRNNPDEATKLLEKAMVIAPNQAEPKHWAGYAEYLNKNYQAAVALYQAAIQLDSGNPMIYKRLGLAYKALEDGASASKAFRRYLELAPDAPDRAEFSSY